VDHGEAMMGGGENMIIDTDTLKKWATIGWPMVLSIFAKNIGPMLNLSPALIESIVTVLNWLFGILVVGTQVNIAKQLNKAGMMQGLGFKFNK
jgi:hypothetical protein